MATATQARNYALAQTKVADQALTILNRTYPSLASDPVAAKRQLIELVQALNAQFGPVSAELAAQYFNLLRPRAGKAPVFTAQAIARLNADALVESTKWAAQPMFDGDRAKSLALASGMLQRNVQQWGRDTFFDAVAKDPLRPRHALVPDVKCCAFCRMLAGRGAVYGEDFGPQFAHDNCKCQFVAVWSNNDLPFNPKTYEDEYLAARKAAGSSDLYKIQWQMELAQRAI